MHNQNNYSNNKNQFERKNLFRKLLMAYRNIINNTNTHNKSNNEKEVAFTENQRETRTGWTDKSVAIGTIVLAFCTLVLAGATIFLAIYTYELYDDASHATDLAKQTHQNDSARAEQRFESDTAFNNRKFNNDTGTINKQIALADKNLQQQIQSLKETKEEFDKEHQSFLFVTPYVDVEQFISNGIVSDSYDFNVIGSQPIRIDSIGIRSDFPWDSGFNTRYDPDSINLVKEYNWYGFQINKQTAYITSEYPMKDIRSPYRDFRLPKDFLETIIRKKRVILLIGKIYYTILVTNNRFIYKYMLVLKMDFANKSFAFVNLYNVNEPINK